MHVLEDGSVQIYSRNHTVNRIVLTFPQHR